MMYRRTLVKVFFLTSLFWLAIDILFLFNILNVQFDFFGTEKLVPSLGENKGFARIQNKRYSDDIFGVIDGLGEGGKAASLPPHLKKKAEKVFNNHSFDVILSDKISLDRELNDYRGPRCKAKHQKYPKHLPTTSVIICFHNEALSVLLRTVHSVINRTPPHLLEDVILVDDFSDYENLKEPLEKQVSKFEKVQVIRMPSREGLVRSRLRGAAISHGEVLTFLDSHCEVTKGWVEPLLARIAENRSNVVCPVIEVIDADTFQYQTSDVIFERGGFSWDLFFTWKSIPESEKNRRKDESDFIRSPTMAGGLFSMHKQYFYDLGSYDDQMDIWGGENLELSFRVWMCGGQLEIVPCSRVGHVFRKYTSPYKFPKGTTMTLAKNFNRLAEVWMDEFKEIYYRKKSAEERNVDIGDISERVALRKRLKCKSFRWYLDNIFPDMKKVDPDPPAQGEVRNVGSGLCVDSLGVKSAHSEKLGLYTCHGLGGNQFFTLTKEDEIVFNDDKCLDVPEMAEGAFVQWYSCHGLKGNQEWKHDKKAGTITHVWTGHCLDVSEDKQFAVVNTCDGRNSQTWTFSKYKGQNITLEMTP